jgi:hypothetical protein
MAIWVIIFNDFKTIPAYKITTHLEVTEVSTNFQRFAKISGNIDDHVHCARIHCFCFARHEKETERVRRVLVHRPDIPVNREQLVEEIRNDLERAVRHPNLCTAQSIEQEIGRYHHNSILTIAPVPEDD